jgi:NADPH-dependent 2,4-dienoyl-CoA reductase/sulfur reductase-like enzyme
LPTWNKEGAVPGHVVVVGASLAGLRAVEAARRSGYRGRITLVGAEPHTPYDRPPLSKDFLDVTSELDAPPLPGAEKLADELDVDLVLDSAATGLDVADHVVQVDGHAVPYDAVLVATGANARTLPMAGALDGVHTLRTVDDARAVRTALGRGARTVVVGAGFIGSEIASSARKRGLAVTILEAQTTPLVRSVGPHAGAALSALHERNGTDLRCGVGVTALLGDDHVRAVRLADGSEIPADLVVVGVGATPATAWLTGSGLTLDNGVVCDEYLRAGTDVYAAGDVARWRSPDFDALLRLEHWTNATEMSACAMRNLLSPPTAQSYSHIPYFWSDWYGSRIQFAGLPEGVPELVTGSWDDDAFVALYRRDDLLVGVLALNRRGDIMKYRALIARRANWQDALDLAATRNAKAPI